MKPLGPSQTHQFGPPFMKHIINVLTTMDPRLALKAALTAPARFLSAIGNKSSFLVIWDSGASISVSPSRDDFVTFTPVNHKVRGVGGKSEDVLGTGDVIWSIRASDGTLRDLRLKCLFVPSCETRLLATQGLLERYPGEDIKLTNGLLVLSGKEGQAPPINISINPHTNLPVCVAINQSAVCKGVQSLINLTTTTHTSNGNLTEAEKELLRWHCRLGHISLRRVQHLMRSGVLSHTESTRKLHSAACKIQFQHLPKCSACLFGKQTTRKIPGKTSSVIKERSGILKADHLFPGQEVSVDHFICSTKGRLLSGYGKTKDSEQYSGGCIFVDHASNYVHIVHQSSMSTHSTLQSKTEFEAVCRNYGVIPQAYISDNGSAFASKDFAKHLETFRQTLRFAGVGAHHHNSIAERNIRTIMSISRTMMLHSALHWPDVADSTLWPMAVTHAVYVWNHMPDPTTGLSPHDVLSKTKWPHKRFHDLHVWGCPTYVLDKSLADGKKIPKWRPRSTRAVFVGFSTSHASSVPLVLNLSTGAITPQYHVVFDDWFNIVSSTSDDPPDFYSDEWMNMFKDSSFQYHGDGDNASLPDDDDLHPDPSTILPLQEVSTAFEQALPPTPLNIPYPTTAPHIPTSVLNPSPEPVTHQHHNHSTENQFRPTRPPTASMDFSQVKEGNNIPSNLPSTPVTTSSTSSTPTTSKNGPTTSSPTLRRSTRTKKSPTRLNIKSNTNNKSYVSTCVHSGIQHDQEDLQLQSFLVHDTHVDDQILSALATKSTKTNPDTYSYDEAMLDKDRITEWLEAMDKEIQELETHGVWEVVNINSPRILGLQVVPSTWTMRVKRAPDGTIRKYKARFCIRGDLQDSSENTYSPVASLCTVRLFLLVTLALGWDHRSIDFSNAFVQAVLKDPVYIHLPRGYSTPHPDGNKYCLKLKRSLYGSSLAPKLWYEHLLKFLVDVEGFQQYKTHDPCLLLKSNFIIILYVDDCGMAFPDVTLFDSLIQRLKGAGFSMTIEGSFAEYLGIQFDKAGQNGEIMMTQQGLINKIISTAGMEDCNPNSVPATKEALSKDPEGPDMSDSWNYRSIVGMMLYLSTNTRPDITFAVSQVARFSHTPKQSHATAVKMIIRYLSGTKTMGTLFVPPKNFKISCYVDADFAGLYNRDPPEDSSSAKSRTGYVISIGGCYLTAKSQLQTCVALSTGESEYYALSQAARTVLPIQEFLKDIVRIVKVPAHLKHIDTTIYEDNSSALSLAQTHRVTSRTCHYLVKWHFFWEQIKSQDNPEGQLLLEKVSTDLQRADYATKGLVKDKFEKCRRLNQGW